MKLKALKDSRLNSTLNDILKHKGPPKIFFVVFLLIYAVTMILLGKASHTNGSITIFGAPIPYVLITGVYSSIANLSLICLVALYGKPGFYISLILLLCDFPSLLSAIFIRHLYTSIPGIFTILFTIIAIIVLYINDIRIDNIQKKLKEQAITDNLTGLPNRYACNDLIDNLIKHNKKFAVVMIDLNNFKNINDTMGHNIGNKVLIEIGQRWREATESGLSGTLDFFARQGGDEFLLIIQDYNSDEELYNTIKYYESVLEEKIIIRDWDYFITASFGYVEYPDDSNNLNTLISHADSAMYEIKRTNTSNHIKRFTPDLKKDSEKTVELERKIRTALSENKIFFHLQPQYDIDHNLHGFEALARIKDENNNFISPADFIPIAEKVGLIDKVDSLVFKNAALFFGSLIRKTHTNICLSINVSVRHMLKDDFIGEVQSILLTSGLPAEQLEIEITESIMMDNENRALNTIKLLKDMGVKIAIDDFGTGYSSLSYLNKIPADILKVDKSFIDKMNTSESSKQYVATIISIGHLMKFDVISEGVEDEDQLETLRSIGCDMIQGFIWGKPMLPEEAEELVLKEDNF